MCLTEWIDIKYIKKAITFLDGIRGDEWIRTTDSRIFSPMLYHLSYITALKWGKISQFYNRGKILHN